MSIERPESPFTGLHPSMPTHLDLPSSDSIGSAESLIRPRFPTQFDLPSTDGLPVENAYHHPQSALLTSTLTPVLDGFHQDGNYFLGADTGIFWQINKEPLAGCKAPDWYYIPNVPRLLDGDIRRSYVLWEEYGRPLIVIEFVSGDGSDERDASPATGKFWVYEHAVAATHYVIWDRSRRVLEAYELWRGKYRRTEANEHGRYPIPTMEVEFGIWDGTFFGYETCWLRAWDRQGRLLPTPQERADKLAAKLRELGVDPDTV